MATFVKGLTDQLGPLQLYRPDYQFLTQVYGTKQAEYDRGFDMVRNLYTSQLSNSLTNSDNERFRQEAFKKLESGLRSVGGLDLSNSKNITYAMSMMDPISKDEDLAYDMAVTKFHAKQKQKMDQYKNSTDPKMRAMYNEVSRMDIAFAEEDMRNAKRGDGSIQNIAPREFVPFDDINEYLRKAAKEEGLEVVRSERDPAGYILKRTNGAETAPIFENWARGVMGNRFDRQLAVTGRVNAESAIRNTMSAREVTRDEASKIVAEQLLPQFATAQSLRGIAAEKQYKNLENDIAFFEKKFPKGFPASNPEIEAEYKRLLLSRDESKEDFENAKSEIAKIQTEGPGYISGNLYGIYTNEAKQKTAKDFAGGYATAKQEVDIRPDSTFATKLNVSSREKIAYQNNQVKMKIAGANLDQRNRELEFKKLKQEQDYDLKVTLAQSKGELSSLQATGIGVSDKPVYASDMLNLGLNKTRDVSFQSVFNAESGLMKIVLNDDAAYGRIYSTLAKVKQMGAGRQVKLSQEDMTNLKEYAKKIDLDLPSIPTDPGLAKELLDVFAGSTYQAAVKALPNYEKTHTLKDVNIKGFKQSMVAFENQVSQMDALSKSMKRVNEEVLNPDGSVKELYKGAVKTGVLADGVYEIDLSGVTSEAGKARISSMIPDYKNRQNPTGNRYDFTKPSAAEMDMLIKNPNSATSITTSEGSNLDINVIKNLSPTELSTLFSDRIKTFYNPGERQVEVTLNVAVGDDVAKKLKLDKPQTLTLNIPYETIQSSQGVLSRFQSLIAKNTIDPVSLGTLSEFLTNPNARAKGEDYKKAIGFDYEVFGVEDANGRPALQYTYNYIDPETRKTVQKSENIYFQPGNVESLKNANEIINQRFAMYYAARAQYGKNIQDNIQATQK